MENKEITRLINSLKTTQKNPEIIQETLSEKNKKDDTGTMLDENQLINE